MKKNLLSALSICVFFTALASANAQEVNANTEVKNNKKSQQSAEITEKEKALRAEIEKNPACQNILNECKKLGFVAGGYKEGKGLWRNCFHPVIAGKSANLQGKDVAVAANANDISACKVVTKEVHKEKKELKGKAGEGKNHEGKAHEGKKAKAAETAPAATPAAQQ